jgi:sec-independent protein translocase protein TatB
MFNIGPLELMVILLLALVVVGPSKLPEVGRSIGRALREFRNIQDEMRDTINFNLDEPVRPKPAPRPRPARTPEHPSSAPETEDLDREPAAEARSVTEPAPPDSGEPRSTEAPRGGEHDPTGAADPATPPGSPNGSSPAPETPRE